MVLSFMVGALGVNHRPQAIKFILTNSLQWIYQNDWSKASSTQQIHTRPYKRVFNSLQYLVKEKQFSQEIKKLLMKYSIQSEKLQSKYILMLYL